MDWSWATTLPHTARAAWDAQWDAHRPPLLAASVAAATWALGRLLRARWLIAAAPGLALAAGWAAVAGGGAPARGITATLPVLAATALVLGAAADLVRWPRAGWVSGWVLAAVAGWALAGEPRGIAGWQAVWPDALVAGAAVAAALALLPRAGPGWPATSAAAGLWLALTLAHQPGWLPVAAVAATACLAAALIGAEPWAVRLPSACALGGGAAAVLVGAGRLPHGAIGAVDLAAGTPLLVLWLADRLRTRLPYARGALAAAAAVALGCVIVAGVASLAQLR